MKESNRVYAGCKYTLGTTGSQREKNAIMKRQQNVEYLLSAKQVSRKTDDEMAKALSLSVSIPAEKDHDK
jgi:hypothetical protein